MCFMSNCTNSIVIIIHLTRSSTHAPFSRRKLTTGETGYLLRCMTRIYEILGYFDKHYHSFRYAITLTVPCNIKLLFVLFVWAYLAYKPYFFNQRTVFFSHNKSTNSTFSHDLSAKQTQANRVIIFFSHNKTSSADL